MYNFSSPEDIYSFSNSDIINLENPNEVSLMISENFQSSSNIKHNLLITSPNIKFIFTSNQSLKFFDYFQVVLQATKNLFLSFTFSEITEQKQLYSIEQFELNKIEQILDKLGIYNNNSPIVLYINCNCTINPHGNNQLNLMNSKIQVLSIQDDVKYFFSFSEYLNPSASQNIKVNVSVLDFKEFKFNKNEKIKNFFYFIYVSNATELSLTNISIEIILKIDEYELKNYIEILKDGKVYFNSENNYIETKIKRLKVVNCPLINITNFEGLFNPNLEYLYIDRNSFLDYSLKIEKIVKENDQLSLTFDDDIDEERDSNLMEVDEEDIYGEHQKIKKFFETYDTVIYNKVKFKNFTKQLFDVSSTQEMLLKIRKLYFANCSVDFINSLIQKIDLTFLEELSLKELKIEGKDTGLMENLSNLQKPINFYFNNVFFECTKNFVIPVNSLILNYDLDLTDYLKKENFFLFPLLIHDNKDLTFENKSVDILNILNQLQITNNNNNQINIEILKFKNCFLSKEVIKIIFNYTGIKEMYFINSSFENKSGIFPTSSTFQIVFDYNSFQNYFFDIPHEKQTIETILFRTFDKMIKEIKERPKDAKPKETFIEFKQVQEAFRQFYNLNKNIIILYNSRKQYVNIVLSICYFSRDMKDESFFKVNVLGNEKETCGISPIFISEEQLKFFQNFSKFFTLIEHKI